MISYLILACDFVAPQASYNLQCVGIRLYKSLIQNFKVKFCCHKMDSNTQAKDEAMVLKQNV